MNNDARKNIAAQIATMEQVIADIEGFRDDEQEKYDNMPEGLQSGEKGEAMQSAIDAFESAISSAEEVKLYLEDASN